MSLTRDDILDAQQRWAEAIVAIGSAWRSKTDYASLAELALDELYAYGQDEVLFKPTKAAERQFRLTQAEALSYFIGGEVAEDKGFALTPWSHVRFGEQTIVVEDGWARAMGNYHFTHASSGEEVKVEFTFVYKPDDQGRARIVAHHSSLPYSG